MAGFGATLARLRKSRGETQATVAAAVGVRRETVARWEAGHSRAALPRLWDVGRFLRLTPDEWAELVRVVAPVAQGRHAVCECGARCTSSPGLPGWRANPAGPWDEWRCGCREPGGDDADPA